MTFVNVPMTTRLLIFSLLLLLPMSQARAQQPSASADTTKKPTIPEVRFVDRDGDGFNDLAADLDGDDIPDALDPDFQDIGADSARSEELFRWAWYRALPDSVRHDSTQFRVWWDENGLAVDWRLAWDCLKQVEATYGPDGRPRWWDYSGFDPRRSPLLDDRRRLSENKDDEGGNRR